ncbi:uncharacterized protein Z518_02997 [Rhinocladiella mackenziei CBS 650.93]|uniref:Rhinocladiella mackenziei CBS 650.93 unplaced genomic scaffold supercont1.2, whole genome shotgun sequence n=1 Tax=Rhinocladiella mackenziei CBS 650.93 TaxID=1442369 RepID=A0A0D2IY66_9EURO|nr:uncharacterized protein Z518_02997 [Rhinocladiella mackenziei CBS 650.93]KIX08341.1 hypothetical protein Z518_02997 [Rhinocladiella mackenziei CBS 650.93]
MPRGRRAKAKTAPSAQSTLSFNNKAARVTKSSNKQDDAVKKAVSKLSEPVKAQAEDEAAAIQEESVKVTPEPEEKVVEVDVATRESPVKTKARRQKNAETAKDERELAAEKITDAQLEKYWKAEEDSRLAPRVHQSTLPLHEKILRHFDLSSQYGPCIGIPRLQRWRRANFLGLEPPIEVLAVLLREENHKTSQGCGKLAYIDELSGGKVVLVE